MATPDDLMGRALKLAEAGRYSTQPNPRVGCVIVKDGVIVGEGAHLKAGEAHAEIHALRMAGENAGGAEVFVTLEPCNHTGRTPPCVDALIAAGVSRVWAALLDPNPQVAGQGMRSLQQAGISTHVGLQQAEAEQLNRGFLLRMRAQRPFVSLKLAASLDGRTAMASGESQWITGAEARADVHRLRADAGAVLTSSATVLVDDPALSVREFHAGALRQPDRIVLDRQAKVPPHAKVWAEGARRYWLCQQAAATVPVGVKRMQIAAGHNSASSMATAFSALAAEQINAVLVECGPRLAGALLAARLVDELVIYLAPNLLGHEARALANLPGLSQLSQRISLRYTDVTQVGDDLRITATFKDS